MWKKSQFKAREYKRRKNGFKFTKFIIIFLFFSFLISSYFLINSDFFEIKKVDIDTKNISCTNINELKDSLNLSGQNLILTNFLKLKEELKKRFICIKSVEISRLFPDRVKLDIFGRQPVAALISLRSEEATSASLIKRFSEVFASASAEASSSAIINFSNEQVSGIFLVDDGGVIFAKLEDLPNIPTLFVYEQDLSLGKNISQDLIRNSLLIFGSLKTFGIEVKEAKIYSKKLLLVDPPADGPRIIFKVDEKIDIQLASLQLILNKAKIDKEKLEFIDLRFDKPIVRFAPKNHGQR